MVEIELKLAAMLAATKLTWLVEQKLEGLVCSRTMGSRQTVKNKSCFKELSIEGKTGRRLRRPS